MTKNIEAWLQRRNVYRSYDTRFFMKFSNPDNAEKLHNKIVKYKNENKAERTPAEIKLDKILCNIGLKHKNEIVIPTKDSFYLLDFVIGEPFWFYLEADGSVHKKRTSYDSQRDDYIMKVTGWICLRFTNEQILNDDLKMYQQIISLLSGLLSVEKEYNFIHEEKLLKKIKFFCSGMNIMWMFDKYFPKNKNINIDDHMVALQERKRKREEKKMFNINKSTNSISDYALSD